MCQYLAQIYVSVNRVWPQEAAYSTFKLRASRMIKLEGNYLELKCLCNRLKALTKIGSKRKLEDSSVVDLIISIY